MTALFVYIVVGLGAGLLLIGLAKGLMAGLLQRSNHYYDDAHDPGGENHG